MKNNLSWLKEKVKNETETNIKLEIWKLEIENHIKSVEKRIERFERIK